jgi:uncharacterized protein
MKKWAITQLFILLAALNSWASISIHEQDGRMIINSLYGRDEIHEPVLITLIKSPMMERIKKIRQYGVAHYVTPLPEFTRFEHCVRVMLLTRRFGGSLGEQIAALLHDVSHTAFSHVADYVFKSGDGKTSYQDDMHEWFVETTGINALLAQYGFAGICSEEHKHAFRILEQELPDLCTDRIDYICYGGLIENCLTQDEVDTIIRDLCFENGRWFFVSERAALLYASTSLYLTEHTFGSRINFFTYRQAAKALKRALEINLITKDEFFFSVDDDIWQKLGASDDLVIRTAVDAVIHCDVHCVAGTPESYDMFVIGKFRGVNPWIKTSDGFTRLTEINDAYAREYMRVKECIAAGCYIKCVA